MEFDKMAHDKEGSTPSNENKGHSPSKKKKYLYLEKFNSYKESNDKRVKALETDYGYVKVTLGVILIILFLICIF